VIVTYKEIKKIKFPVFILPNSNWELIDGLLLIDNQVVDDKNMPGASLGIRRLQTHFTELVPLKHSIDSLIGILKQTTKYFIDSNGTPFIYQKTMNASLKYYKIRKIERKEVASVLWLKDINFPFTIPRPPPAEKTWAGVLHIGGLPWLLYEYSEERLKDTRRKV
jgi:hypothetical protein